MKKRQKILIVLIMCSFMVCFSNYTILKAAKNKTYNTIHQIKKNKVGLVLGTSKLTQNNRINLYYKYRLEATIRLYKAGKIDFILFSGDNSSVDNDEPTDFKNDLIAQGIPKEKIFLDYAGFRTLDSIIRAKEIFGLTEVTIISQKFHNQRAIYLAQKKNITAIGFNAKSPNRAYSYKTNFREYLAKTKALIDIIFNVQPKFLGKKIKIK